MDELPIVTPAEMFTVKSIGQGGSPANVCRFTFCDDVVILMTDGATVST